MAFRVEITPRAEADLERIYSRVLREAPGRGAAWCDRFEASILSLSTFPERCEVEPKLSSSRRTVRKLLFGRRRDVYRVYYAIFDDVVRVLHVRHGARKDPKRV
ncbi:MAG: type II toxin-antitoxin system RelE/ParE family toxin [Acidobacteria bacterium]|nr:type II toxin-antitoxin system RelE/ParE family toxin [Acidobacteriota bacterium]